MYRLITLTKRAKVVSQVLTCAKWSRCLVRGISQQNSMRDEAAIKKNFSSSKILFTTESKKHRHDYDLLTAEFFVKVSQDIDFITKFEPSSISEGCLKIFLNNFFPESSRQGTAHMIINYLNSNRISTKPGENFEFANQFMRGFRSTIELLDKSNKGLLTGDLSINLIFALQQRIPLLVSSLDTPDLTADQRIECISNFYDEVCKVAFSTMFRIPQNGIPFPDEENPRNLFERQLALEDESNDIAVDKFLAVYQDLQKFGLSVNLKFARNHIVEWFPSLCKVIKREQEECLLGGENIKNERRYYSQYISRLSAEKMALISLTELMKSILKIMEKRHARDELNSRGIQFQIINKVLFDTIGNAINMQILYDFEEELLKEQDTQQKMASPTGEPTEQDTQQKSKKKMSVAKRSLSLSPKVLKKRLDADVYQNIGIPKDVRLKLGSLMLYFMKETIKVRNKEGHYEPLLTLGYTKLKRRPQYLGISNVNEEFIINLVDKAERSESMFLHLERSLPMIFKPAPWQDYEIGGYYQKPTNLMRIQESFLQEKTIKFADLTQIYHVLNILGETPWRINSKILDVMEAIWEEGGGAGTIPSRQYDYTNYVYQYQLDECRNHQERQKLKKKIQAQRDIHSLRCDFTLKLNVAKSFRNISKIYFPHNVDFRGRIYPVPPHLNHIGADLSRGLLEFSEGKPIGKNGINWLKIHCANKMGKDKLSFPERIQYVDANMGLIEKCARDPLKHREWLEFEDSWQSLASMFDLVAAMESRNPSEYISHLHIHQDGSCNGLQHYAALGRDFAGAEQVNLMNTARPGDIYTHVANMVQERVNKHAEDPSSKHHEIAKKLVGNIKRKIVKQTVMTSVYGVTFIGAREQIFKQLKDKDFVDHENEDYQASFFIAQLTLDCIKDLFSGAHEIKKWLIKCAGLVAETSNPVSWITPLGLPVVQPYRKKNQVDVITTLIQKVTVTNNNDLLPINKNKQKSAFPPNYIHSLDSTHLMFTAVECKKENITFAAVHDSYWTHAGTLERMNELLRNQFIKLHSMPLLESLKRSFEIRYPQIEFPPIPQRVNCHIAGCDTCLG